MYDRFTLLYLKRAQYCKSTILQYNFFLFFFRATHAAYLSFQARGQVGAAAAGLQRSHGKRCIQAASVTNTAACGNT